MNQYLTEMLNIIGIDINHLVTEYLNPNEVLFINEKIKSKQDFKKNFYTDENGENLEVLLHFMNCHKQEIIEVMEKKLTKETLINFYTSASISANYDCFRFDLSKFPHTYTEQDEILFLYRIGRENESKNKLGCSWAMNTEGLRSFYDSSSLNIDLLKSRPVFKIEVNDFEVLFEGTKTEYEVVLKPNFQYEKLEILSNKDKEDLLNLTC